MTIVPYLEYQNQSAAGLRAEPIDSVALEYQSETGDIEAALALAMLDPIKRPAWQENTGIDEAVTAQAHDRFAGIGERLGVSLDNMILANWNEGLDGQWTRLEDALFKERVRGLLKISWARKRYSRSLPEARAKSRIRQKPEVRAKDIRRMKLWRVLNHDKELLQLWLGQRKEKRDLHYHRPFIAIDSEGCDFPGKDIERDGAVYPAHATFLWGAAGVERDVQGNWHDLPLHWLGDDNKRPLKIVEILEWLLSLPEIYVDAIFCSFGFNCDVTMILAQLVRKKVYEICKKKKFGTEKGIKGHVFYGAYTIDYLKGKRLVIKKFRNPDENPYDERGRLRKDAFIKKIVIYDLFGFYQCGFVKVMKSLQKMGLVTAEEVAAMERDKKRRNKFGQVPLEQIKTYTELELRKLSVAATRLRDGFDYMGVKLKSWSGAGQRRRQFI
jgi:hypothetical protein